jgi:hypothetical protein
VRIESVAVIFILGTTACGQSDRCLDHGGRWNDSVEVCEFAPGPLATPGDAIAAAKSTLEFAYGPGVLDQEPFLAVLDGGVWHVYGTPPRASRAPAAEAWIEFDSGSVQKVAYGR